MSIVVATKTTEFALEMRGSHDFDKTVSIPGYFQTCFGRHFQEVAVQVDVEVRRLAGQRDARAVPAHGQVLLEAHGAGAQHQVHRLGPGEGAGPARVVLHQHLKGRGRGGAVFCQNVLTRPLKVKCPSVKSVVVGISEHRANAGLFSANRTASFSVENFTLWAAADGNALLLSTLCLAFHASTDGAINRGPHLSIPENLVAKLAHLDIFWRHSQEALFTTGLLPSDAATRVGAFLLTYYGRVPAGACSAVIIEK